jgi:ABC-type sugar transport system ATPase subunit
LLDEPFGSLDLPQRTELRRQLHLLHQSFRATIIQVTHDQTEALALADRVAVLHEGRLQQVGTPAEVYAKPGNLLVAGFIGFPAMCLAEGPVEADGAGRFWVRTLATRVPVPAKLIEQRGPLPAGSLTLGIRPEHVRLHPLPPESSGDAARTVMTVTGLERLGNLTLVRLRRESWEWTLSQDGECSLKEGQEVAVELPAPRLHWFDPTTGQRRDC